MENLRKNTINKAALYDPAYGKEMDEKIIHGLISSPRVMRSMPSMFRQASLELQKSPGWVLTEVGNAGFFLLSLNSLSVLLPWAAVVTLEEVEQFVADQRKTHEVRYVFRWI